MGLPNINDGSEVSGDLVRLVVSTVGAYPITPIVGVVGIVGMVGIVVIVVGVRIVIIGVATIVVVPTGIVRGVRVVIVVATGVGVVTGENVGRMTAVHCPPLFYFKIIRIGQRD
jgi:hypothetical protein